MNSELLKLLEEQLDHNDKPLPWKLPKVITAEIKLAAQDKLDYIEKYNYLPPTDTVRRWLKSLAPLIESAKTANEIELRIAAMAGLLDYPAYCFTKETLYDFAKKCEFLPTLKKLSDFFDNIVTKVKYDVWKCKKILEEKEYYNKNNYLDKEKPDDREHALRSFSEILKVIKEVQ